MICVTPARSYCVCWGGVFENRKPSPSAMVGCASAASRSRVNGKSAIIAVCTTAMTSPASAPIMVKPRMRSSFSADKRLHEASLSPVACARSTALIGSVATRGDALTFRFAFAQSDMGERRVGEHAVGNQPIARAPPPPARLSRTMRKSSSDMWVNIGLPAHSPKAQTSGALVSSRSLTRTKAAAAGSTPVLVEP